MPIPGQAGDDFGRHLTTLLGWRKFIATSLGQPMAIASEAEYEALVAAAESDPSAKEKKNAYDDDRLDHHARLQVIATSTVRHSVTCGRRLIILNRGAVSARRACSSPGQRTPARRSLSPNSAWPTNSWTGAGTRTRTNAFRSSTSPSRHPRLPA